MEKHSKTNAMSLHLSNVPELETGSTVKRAIGGNSIEKVYIWSTWVPILAFRRQNELYEYYMGRRFANKNKDRKRAEDSRYIFFIFMHMYNYVLGRGKTF